MIEQLFAKFPVEYAWVRITKPDPPIPGHYRAVGVEMRRSGTGEMSERAYIALGSNVGDRLSYLRRALKALKEHPEIRLSALSSVYETKPVGLTEQADFLNMVAAVDTALSPHALLDVTQGIEQALHRRREIRWVRVRWTSTFCCTGMSRWRRTG